MEENTSDVTADLGIPPVEALDLDNNQSKRKTRNPRRTSDSLRRIQRDQRRLSRALMTPEQREEARKKARENQRRKRAGLTPEQKEIERQTGRERMRRKRASMTPEQKEKKRQHERERMRLKRASLDPEKKEAIRKKDRERMRIKRATLDPAEKEAARKKDRERMRRVRGTHTKEDNESIEEEVTRPQCELSELDTEHGESSAQAEENSIDAIAKHLSQPSDVHPAEVKWQWKYINQDTMLCQS